MNGPILLNARWQCPKVRSGRIVGYSDPNQKIASFRVAGYATTDEIHADLECADQLRLCQMKSQFFRFINITFFSPVHSLCLVIQHCAFCMLSNRRGACALEAVYVSMRRFETRTYVSVAQIRQSFRDFLPARL